MFARKFWGAFAVFKYIFVCAVFCVGKAHLTWNLFRKVLQICSINKYVISTQFSLFFDWIKSLIVSDHVVHATTFEQRMAGRSGYLSWGRSRCCHQVWTWLGSVLHAYGWSKYFCVCFKLMWYIFIINFDHSRERIVRLLMTQRLLFKGDDFIGFNGL